MHVLIESRRAEIRALAERHGLHEVRVFGSMARGDVDQHGEIDLLVTLPTGKTGLALGALLMDVQDLLGRRVDVVTEGCLHPSVRSRVLNQAQLLRRWVRERQVARGAHPCLCGKPDSGDDRDKRTTGLAADSYSEETGIAMSDSVSGSESFERQITPPGPTRPSDFLRVTRFRA